MVELPVHFVNPFIVRGVGATYGLLRWWEIIIEDVLISELLVVQSSVNGTLAC